MKTKKWKDLYGAMPAERRARVETRVQEALQGDATPPSAEARLTQKQIAETMRIDQSRVSKIERRTDAYVSTLRNFIAALGGELELVARFPDGRVKISKLGDPELLGTVGE